MEGREGKNTGVRGRGRKEGRTDGRKEGKEGGGEGGGGTCRWYR
jgi:hypothetical protein